MEKFNQIINNTKPVLVDFYADWCAPCRTMTPILKQVKDDLGDKIRIIKVDVERNPEISQKYNIHSIPTIMLFKNGNVRWSGMGVVSAIQLKNIVISNS